MLDAQTGQPLPFASIYVNLTTMGTYADDKGAFMLNNLPAGVFDIIISYIGHKPYMTHLTVKDSADIPLTVRLAVESLKEVQITAKRDPQWFKDLEKFTRLFLGTEPSDKLCKIMNPWVLSFNETKSKIFNAAATSPIEIENMNLGYKVTYDLRNFAVSKKNYIAAGYVRFQEMQTTDTTLAMKWTANRRKAYEGSVNDFFHSVIENKLRENGYAIYEDRSELTHMVRQSYFLANLDKTIFIHSLEGKVKPIADSTFYTVQLPHRLEVHYKKERKHSKIYWDIPFPVSWIEVKGGFLDVTKDGLVVNPLKMVVMGSMFDEKLKSLLPNNYKPDSRKQLYKAPPPTQKNGQLAQLAEKPYLHTDRSYYYPEETIWFKGYMNYASPIVSDSLSKVLNVDLVDSKNTIVSTAAFLIDHGFTNGAIDIPNVTMPGDYTLRAYTRWMLNFDTAFVFKKSIRVLDLMEAVHPKTYDSSRLTASNVVIIPDKADYGPREKVTVRLDVLDDPESRVPANFSVSVTNLSLAVPAPDEISILTSYSLPSASFPDTLKTARLAIQKGFDLQGKFVPPKGKITAGLITFVQNNADTEFTITTQKDGTFFLPDLILSDSTRLSYVARTTKGKYGEVTFDSVLATPGTRPARPLQLSTYTTMKSQRYLSPDRQLKATLLEAVTVKSARIRAKRTSIVEADYEVSGEWLQEQHTTDVLSAIQTRVPGMRVIVKYEGGFPKKYLSLGGMSFSGSTEPLVVIDGQVVNEFEGGAAEQISSLNPNQIDHVEVNRFSSAVVYGARGGNGVIAIFTTSGAAENEAVDLSTYDKNKLRPLFRTGFSSPKPFTSPDYTSDQQAPDLDNRATIYWNPTVTTNGSQQATLSFYAADSPGEYRIVAEGVTIDGRPVHGEGRIIVKGKN